MQQDIVFVTQGKNMGRENETTPLEQCMSEAHSKWHHKLARERYSPDKNQQVPFQPMLAKTFNQPNWLFGLKDGKHIEFPAFWQPKLDGIRCVAKWYNDEVVLLSRQNKRFMSLPHIAKALAPLLKQNPTFILDGELYNHTDSFQQLTSFIRKDKPHDDSHKIQYHIYDMFNTKSPEWTFTKRWYTLQTYLRHVNSLPCPLQLVPTNYIFTKGDLAQIHAEATANGYEGVMLRNFKGVYEIGKRSKHLQKVKLFLTEEFEIVDAYENKGRQKGQCTLVCITKQGQTFGVKPKGDEQMRQQYWHDWQHNNASLKGKMLTVQFFSWTSSENPVPRFPVGLTVRDYE